MIRFGWDADKAAVNIKKHGVSFEEAQSVFFDEHAIQFFNENGSSPEEDRFLMLGLSFNFRILIVCHCARENDELIRIISARKATKSEAKYYNDQIL
jgi:uncharacterized DUF497 family protein